MCKNIIFARVAYADCNKDCHCSKLPYQPVCSIHGVQYFSACHAGCGLRSYSIENSVHVSLFESYF